MFKMVCNYSPAIVRIGLRDDRGAVVIENLRLGFFSGVPGQMSCKLSGRDTGRTVNLVSSPGAFHFY